MLRPTDIEQIKGNNSRYAVVIAVAKRAREIAQKADENGDILTEKPVKLAVDDFVKNRCKMVESSEIGVIRDRRVTYIPTTSLEDDE